MVSGGISKVRSVPVVLNNASRIVRPQAVLIVTNCGFATSRLHFEDRAIKLEAMLKLWEAYTVPHLRAHHTGEDEHFFPALKERGKVLFVLGGPTRVPLHS